MATEDKTHLYKVEVTWTGNTGQGTASYKTYDRSHEISGTGKPVISGSSDAAFRGDRTKYNPEELLVASLSTCHMLWYLHLCAEEQLVVTRYIDRPVGKMIETDDGSGRFAEVILKPTVTVREGANSAMAEQLHENVKEGALADLLVVNGSPLENIKLIENPAQNFVVIMKDGKLYKNLLL